MKPNSKIERCAEPNNLNNQREGAGKIVPLSADGAGRGGNESPGSTCDRALHELQAEKERLAGALREAEARAAQAELGQVRQEIEERVRLGNEELARANEALRREIEEHRQDEERIREQNEFLNQVLESLTHPFYVLDANDYTIKMANSAAIKGELTPGITCYALTHHRQSHCDGSEHGCPLQLIKESKKPVTLEHIHFDREGNPRNMEVHGYPIFDRKGNVVQMIEYSLDITERKEMERELRESAERIKQFAYAVSHDLKSPMVGILGLARLLHHRYGHTLDAKGEKICDRIRKGIEHLSALVEEINAFVKAKESAFHFEEVNPLDLLEMVREEFASRLSQRRLSWSEPECMPQLSLDRISMLRVFRNLVDNALKYGGERLSAIAIGYRDDGQSHLISFSDDGVGIKEQDFERIFELFKRNEEARGIEGSGLGLAIVREIVAKHGGKVWVESAPAGGTTFYLALPKDQV
jgi:signal transduction histidine kinase